jgi:hypothetical protein
MDKDYTWDNLERSLAQGRTRLLEWGIEAAMTVLMTEITVELLRH